MAPGDDGAVAIGPGAVVAVAADYQGSQDVLVGACTCTTMSRINVKFAVQGLKPKLIIFTC